MEVVLLVIVGSVAGSFLNVVIHRVPRGESVVYPPSHCVACGRRLTPPELVPVLSWVALRGRCRGCGVRISLKYPLVEAGTAAMYLLVVWRFGVGAKALFYAALVSLLIALGVIDLEHRIIPNKITAAGAILGVIMVLALRPIGLADALAGSALGAGSLLIVAVASRGGMGGGDVKLAGMMGLYLGWRLELVALFLGVLAGAAAGLFLIMLNLKKRRDFIPFGPFLALGGVAAMIWGERLVEWYVGRLGL